MFITSYQNYANENNEIFFIIQIGKDKNYLANLDIIESMGRFALHHRQH